MLERKLFFSKFIFFTFVCLQLSKKVKLKSNRVQPILLPNPKDKLKDKAKCRVAGWGLTKTGGKVVNVLQEVNVPIVNLEDCKNLWKEVPVSLPDNVMCAGGYGTKNGFCQVCFLVISSCKWFLIQKNDSSFFLLTGWIWWPSGVRSDSCWCGIFQHEKRLPLPKCSQHLYWHIQIPSLDQRYSEEEGLLS